MRNDVIANFIYISNILFNICRKNIVTYYLNIFVFFFILVLDHEERSIYRLTVAATDDGQPPRQTVRQLKVEVLDLNDNRPTFTSSSLSFKVSAFSVFLPKKL